MSRASMVATMAGQRASIFGIGRFGEGARQVDFEIGWPEFERDIAWAHRMLELWQIGPRQHVLMSTKNMDGPWISAVERALRAIGVVYCNAEPFSWDARRSATFLRLLPIRAIVGMSRETADALLASEETVRRLADVPLIWALPEAIEPLRTAGLRPAVLAKLGPALALECPERAGAHLDPTQWQPGSGPDGLTLSVVGDRAYQASDIVLDTTGRIDETPCDCGLPGPRLRLDGLS
jgi:hypothetical protein